MRSAASPGFLESPSRKQTRNDGIREVRRGALRFVKLDYDGSAGLAPLDPSEVGQVSRARDDG